MKRVFVVSSIFLIACILTNQGLAEQLTPELVKEKAIAAAKLIEKEGEAAFEKIKDPNGEFRFADGDGYIWVQTPEPVMLMHPIKPQLDGTELFEYQDVNGVYLFIAFSEICEDHGQGWVPYMWPKPGEEGESPKVSYVVKVEHGGKEYIAGCGMYDVTREDILAKFPGDAIYEE